ncbi:sprT domain-containing protein [Pseudahrensia aquimaris]|uniref:SprT domain-containing protein n=1 Tax=Pseudahrensia aquimaris TaxID=744461 RepID=A0ABW3FK85_9HYPH
MSAYQSGHLAHRKRPLVTNSHNTLVVNSIVRSNSSDNETSLPPTLEAGAELQYAYDYFNAQLFVGKLPQCLITYTRKKNVLGHFWPDRFQRVGGELWPELALNPSYLAVREDRDSLSTLVHEQAHVARHFFGPPNRSGGRGGSGYHDQPWVEIMEQVGLIPSNTGAPGGKKTGYQMTHYIKPGGLFDIECQRLLDAGFSINWRDSIFKHEMDAPAGNPSGSDPIPKKKDRIKFTCLGCGLNAWAKPSALLTCTLCEFSMSAATSPPATSASINT